MSNESIHAATEDNAEGKATEQSEDSLLGQMQADLEQGRWDNGLINDVIDSLRKSANDERLAQRDRAVLADDVTRIKDYQDHHNNWPK